MSIQRRAESPDSPARHPFARIAGAGRAHLRIMATSDLHAHVWPWDYYTDRPDPSLSLAQVSALAAGLRAGAANALLLDNGDFLQGSPLGDFAFESGQGPAHPVVAAMNAAGFDAGTLGNHEFNYGLEFLMEALSGAAFPIVCANLLDAGGRPVLPPFALLDRELKDGAGASAPIRIGVIGFLPPQIMLWDARHLAGRLTALDIVAAAEAQLPALKGAGAEIVIALCHSGIGAPAPAPGMENAAIPLARVKGIDALILGHSHRVLPGPDHEGAEGVDAARGLVGGRPAAMPGAFGSHLAAIDLLLRRSGGRWRVEAAESAVIAAGAATDDAVLRATRAAHEATLAHIRRPVGRSAGPLHTYFALVEEAEAVRLVAAAQAEWMRRRLEGTEWAGLPLLSAASPFKAGGRGGPDHYTDAPAGELAIRNVADLYLYPNTIRALLVTGAEAKGWLERAAGLYNRIEPGAVDAPLIDPAFPAFNFDTLFGLTWALDLTQPALFDREGAPAASGEGRVRDLRHKGAPVAPGARFVIVTNNYRASGGGAFPGASEARVIFEGTEANRDILLDHVRAAGTICPGGPPSWRFAPIPGATAIFESGPGSAAHAAGSSLALEPGGRSRAGFLRWRLRFPG